MHGLMRRPPVLVVQVSGLRTDGKMPSSYIADTTTANAQVRAPRPAPLLHQLTSHSRDSGAARTRSTPYVGY